MPDRQYYDWPAGYWPLHTRLRAADETGKVVVAKPGTPVVVEKLDGDLPTAMLDYYTREVAHPPLVAERSLIRLLVPKGKYGLTWQPTGNRAPVRTEYHALDPLDSAYAVPFRDGHDIWIRPGRWDKLILNEQQHRKLPLKGHRVLDGGGHIGTFTRDAVHQGAEFVVAYEADVINHTLFKANTAHIDPTQLQHFHTALGGDAAVTTATLSLNLIGEGGGNALHSIHSRPSDRPKVTIPMVEIVNVCEEYKITCIKLDVEDAEGDYDYSRLPPSVKVVSVETKYFDDVPRRLREAGFTQNLKPFNTSNRAITGVVARP